jgi:hypothetical protein
MPFLLEMEGSGSKVRNFYFEEEKAVKRGGWKSMLLKRVEDREDGRITMLEEYEPAKHDGTNHYMSRPWKSRLRRIEHGHSCFELCGAFGNPGSKIPLTWIKSIPQSIYIKSMAIAQHIRVNPMARDNLIWFYRKDDEWIIEFGEDGNSRMNAHRFTQRTYEALLGHYTVLHETARGAQDPSLIEHV